MKDRPSMETMVKRYEVLQADLFDSPGAGASAPSRGPSRPTAWAGAGQGARTTRRPSRSTCPTCRSTGVYDAADWDKVKALVEQVGPRPRVRRRRSRQGRAG